MTGVVESLVGYLVAVSVGSAFDVEGYAILAVVEDLGEGCVGCFGEFRFGIAVLVCYLDNAYDLLECGSESLEVVGCSPE